MKNHVIGIAVLLIYRITQEALTNIACHVQASTVKVTISNYHEYLSIEIEDNGKGFETKRAFNPQTKGISFGLLGMRERVNLLGGYFDIQSHKEVGTRISIKLPIGKDICRGKDHLTLSR